MPLPYLPPSSPKRSCIPCVDVTAMPPSPRMVFTISCTKPAASGLEFAPTRLHSSSAISADSSAPASIMRSFATSVAQKMPDRSRSSGIPVVSRTMYLLLSSILFRCPIAAALPVTYRASTTARCFVSGFSFSTAYQSGMIGISRKFPSSSVIVALSKVMP